MKYYLIGIKGAGMSSLALLLSDLGNLVVGYDDAKEHRFTEDNLNTRNIKIYTDPNLYKLDKDTIIVRSPAIRDNHPEMKRAIALGLENYEYQEMLGKFSRKFKTIGVAGCHGKTTTSSMLSHVLNNTIGANYIIGDGHGYANKDNKLLVLESCEYRRHFLDYSIYYAIITNIELDHTDYYKDINDVMSAYESFANNTFKCVVAWGNDPYIKKLNINKEIYYYGLEDGNDVVARNVSYKNDGTSFDVYIKNEFYHHFDISLYGKHMLLNSLAVITICYLENILKEDINKYLKRFKGASRRFKETIVKDNIIIDDYAHHPTEIKVTIESARQKYPNKQIIAIFKPHTFSRVKEFYKEFANSLNLADYAYVMDINYDRELPEEYKDITPYTIINELNNGNYIDEKLVSKLFKYHNSVILFMSSKEIYLLEDLYIKGVESE